MLHVLIPLILTGKGCSTSSCSESALTACGEWAVCPTKPDGSDPDCSKAPALVSNSWGGGRGDKWYEPITEAWIAGGIVPLFSIGNAGKNQINKNPCKLLLKSVFKHTYVYEQV